MSKIALKASGSGTATYTIEAPSGSTNRILELPDEAGKILTDVGVPTSAMPAGSVLQVASTTKTDVFSVSLAAGATSSAITGFSASITPTSASSKILLVASINGGSNGIVQGFILTRDSSTLTAATGNSAGSRSRVTSASFPTSSPGALQVPVTYLDSPNTTSQVTYEFLMVNGSGVTQTHYINRSHQDTDTSIRMRAISTITLLEIAG